MSKGIRCCRMRNVTVYLLYLLCMQGIVCGKQWENGKKTTKNEIHKYSGHKDPGGAYFENS